MIMRPPLHHVARQFLVCCVAMNTLYGIRPAHAWAVEYPPTPEAFRSQAIVGKLAAASFIPEGFLRQEHLDVIRSLPKAAETAPQSHPPEKERRFQKEYPPISAEERLERWRDPFFDSPSLHAVSFARILYNLPPQAYERSSLAGTDPLGGKIADIGLETSFEGSLLPTNLVVELRRDGVDAIGISPNLETNAERTLRKGTIQKMPALDSEFDMAVSMGLLDIAYLSLLGVEPFQFYAEAASELRRVLKDGAPFVTDFFYGRLARSIIEAFEHEGFEYVPIFWDFAGAPRIDPIGLFFINHKPEEMPPPPALDRAA